MDGRAYLVMPLHRKNPDSNNNELLPTGYTGREEIQHVLLMKAPPLRKCFPWALPLDGYIKSDSYVKKEKKNPSAMPGHSALGVCCVREDERWNHRIGKLTFMTVMYYLFLLPR